MSVIFEAKGNISLALVLVIISLLSSVTLALFISTDTASFVRDMEYIQEQIHIRSEFGRSFKLLQNNPELGIQFNLPPRRIIVNGSHYARTYDVSSQIVTLRDNPNGISAFERYKIKCYAKSRGTNYNSPSILNNKRESRYGEADVAQLSLAAFHYLTDIESTTNNTSVRFWGNDYLHGRIHSNDDIVIANGGNNPYNGVWPCFFSRVTTSGHLIWADGMGPYDLIFRGGYDEEVSLVELSNEAELVRQYGQTIYLGSGNNDEIFAVNVTPGQYYSRIGTISYGSIDTLYHYQYNGSYVTIDSLNYFRMTHKDTLWTVGPSGQLANNAGMVYGAKLWIRGTFLGKQTWACEDTISLTGDILLAMTPPGDAPDNEDNPNNNDYVGIISEKSIEVKYGYCDPFQALLPNGCHPRIKPNCENGGINIYAALCALGLSENENPNYDGVFTIEYQHPHPSTPDTVLPYLNASGNVVDTLFTMLDLHGLHYSTTGWNDTFITGSLQSNDNVWLGTLDYPFYNPLWPEAYPIRERGAINLWGSIAQRRRGFVHRSNVGNVNLEDNRWYFNNSEITGVPQYGWQVPTTLPNADGTSGIGTGYQKNYHCDRRFNIIAPPYYPSTGYLFILDGNQSGGFVSDHSETN
ncbi:MAG: hypothetical protein JXR56_03915 [Candidatus Cloacimonetes bacterium]|nr:hypothetical protein [Candidatus Cloacimonadota bacterium]